MGIAPRFLCLLVLSLSSCSLLEVNEEFNVQGKCIKEQIMLEGTVYRKCVEREVKNKDLPKDLQKEEAKLLSDGNKNTKQTDGDSVSQG